VPLSDLRLGIGVDAVKVERVQRLLSQHPDRATDIFTERELAYCRSKRRAADHLAARFAAKEAVLKAFGTGVAQRMRLTEVEVVNDAVGRPRVNLAGTVAQFARRRGLADLDVSLSHTDGLAIAHAVSLWAREPE
jgi:holo-[acyl-carrier protein] synthase